MNARTKLMLWTIPNLIIGIVLVACGGVFCGCGWACFASSIEEYHPNNWPHPLSLGVKSLNLFLIFQRKKINRTQIHILLITMNLESILGIGFIVGGFINIGAYGYLLFVVTFKTREHLPKGACKYCFLDPCVWRLLENYRQEAV